MSQMPDSIYLHKDSKYNTGGLYSAYDDNLILAENEFDDRVLDDYVEYMPVFRHEEFKNALLEWAKEHQEGERQGSYTWSCYQIFIDKLNEM